MSGSGGAECPGLVSGSSGAGCLSLDLEPDGACIFLSTSLQVRGRFSDCLCGFQ